MKTIAGFVVTLFLLAFAFTSRMLGLPQPPPDISYKLISPKAGEVLYTGQTFRVEWESSISVVGHLPAYCEMELWLSLDGGRTFIRQITPSMDPRATFFNWIVPNMPTNSALLEICYGGEPFYPDALMPQTASPFVIRDSGVQ